MSNKIKFLVILLIGIFAISCQNGGIDETEPSSRNFIEPCPPNEDCDNGDPGDGDGGGNQGPHDYLRIYMGGKNTDHINIAQSKNSISSYQANGGLPTNHQTGEGLSAVYFNNKEVLFHVGANSENVQVSYGTASGWSGNNAIDAGVIRSSQAPSATVWNNKIYLAWKSLNSNAIYMVNSTNPQATTWSSPVRIITDTENDNFGDGNPPYLTTYNGKLYAFWAGSNTYKVFYREKATEASAWGPAVEITGTNFSGTLKQSGVGGVAAQEYNGKLYAVYVDQSKDLQFRQVLPYPGNNYVTHILSTAESSARPSMTVFDNKLLVVYKGSGNHSIYYSYWNGTTWYGDLPIGTGETKEDPAVLYFNR